MDENHKRVLIYLQNRHWIALGAIIDECPGATKEILLSLHDEGFVDYEKLVGDGNVEFFRPTKKGTRFLWSYRKRMITFVTENWIALSGILLGLAGVVTGIASIIAKN